MIQRFDALFAAADEWIATGRNRIGKRSVPLYAATRPNTEFRHAIMVDKDMAESKRIGLGGVAIFKRDERDAWLHAITVRVLRNETL